MKLNLNVFSRVNKSFYTLMVLIFLSNFFLSGYGAGDGQTEIEKTLADTSLSLLLLLTNHCTDTSAFKNPFRESLFSFANSSGMI